MAISQYFDLGMGQKGYEEEGSRDGAGEIWGDMLKMCQHNHFCMTYFTIIIHADYLLLVWRWRGESVRQRGGLSVEEGKARTTREQIKQVHASFIYNSNDT